MTPQEIAILCLQKQNQLLHKYFGTRLALQFISYKRVDKDKVFKKNESKAVL